ncbi:Sortase family protein [Blastococcus aurantiacus]|uniref:Sortase family protein n=1 Tax=Blastococcus aurantiacus TaxID=1550231 RepID=A0A1G7HWI5_9ACTN|nr:class F sortase [Blastococcus aurantiacus]SDF04544.1 Sortase family protein [Blastococcus aurantiacus]
MRRPASVVLSLLLSLTGSALLIEYGWGPETTEGSRTPTSAGAAARTVAPAARAHTAPDRSGVPVRLEIPFASSNHPGGVAAPISADSLTGAGDLFVPSDPRAVSWAREDAAPGAHRGTAILVGHVNSVLDGELVRGALSDLAEYAVEHVGEEFTVVLADGRELVYRITGGEQYDKEELAARPELRAALYDQQSAFGPAPGTGRLVLVSCGGAFDRASGNYEDNVFVFALPVDPGAPANVPVATG